MPQRTLAEVQPVAKHSPPVADPPRQTSRGCCDVWTRQADSGARGPSLSLVGVVPQADRLV